MTLALELTIRMVGAAILGSAIGYERELRGKGAGIRTHLLVGMGALNSLGKQVTWFSLNRQGDTCKAEVQMLIKKKVGTLALLERLSAIPDIQVETLE